MLVSSWFLASCGSPSSAEEPITSDTADSGVPVEACNGVDDDGDRRVDEGFPDTDEDGHADCVDVEVCDGRDNDGDGEVDEDYLAAGDEDGDGWLACADCADLDPASNPGATEQCGNALDEDCDGATPTCDLYDDGRRFWGEYANLYAGAAVAAAGDVDGDGLADVLVGGPGDGEIYGRAYLLFGRDIRTSYDVTLGRTGARIQQGWSPGIGERVAGVGDVDGDGAPEVAVAALADGGRVGIVGGTLDGTVDLETEGVVLVGAGDADRAGSGLAGPGDVDGDGLADLVIGAPGANDGVGMVVFVSGGGLVGGTLVGPTLRGAGAAGAQVAAVGDTDGDGIAEVLVASPTEPGTDLHLVPLPFGDGVLADAGLRWTAPGEVALGRVGDLDGDGADDLGVAAPGGGDAGALYLWLAPPAADADESTADFVVFGSEVEQPLGTALTGGGDLDGDGAADLVVTAAARTEASLAWVGQTFWFAGPVASGTRLTSDADRRWEDGRFGSSVDDAGAAVAFVGDTDGDGFDDLLLGDPHHDYTSPDYGAAWILQGGAEW